MAVDTALPEVVTLAPASPEPLRYDRFQARALLASDLAMLALASVAAVASVERWIGSDLALGRIALTAGACTAAWVFLFGRLGLYHRSFAFTPRDEIYCAITALAVGALPILALFTIVPSISSSRVIVVATVALAFVTVSAGRLGARRLYALRERRGAKRIAIVGPEDEIARLRRMLLPSEAQASLAVDVADVDGSLREVTELAFEDLDEVAWLRRARGWHCDVVWLTRVPPPAALPALLRKAAAERFALRIVPAPLPPGAYDAGLEIRERVAYIVPRPLPALDRGSRIAKRLLDIAIAAPLLALSAPIMAAAALAIRLEDGGPVFFRQERVGLFGRTFAMLKFRSMRIDAEATSGPIWSPTRDDRVTRVGRFIRRTSIDELPQLLNVLRGDMSIVGPRPERPVFVERFRTTVPRYDERLLVRPGITGWAQLRMERKLSPDQVTEKLAYDLWYIRHWNVFMDLSIVCKTAAEFLFHRA